MQNEKLFSRFYEDFWEREVLIHWILEHHVQKVFDISQILLWLYQWQASVCSEGDSSKHRHLSDKFDCRELSLDGIVDVECVVDKT